MPESDDPLIEEALRVADEQLERGQVVDGEEAIARLRARIGRRRVLAEEPRSSVIGRMPG